MLNPLLYLYFHFRLSGLQQTNKGFSPLTIGQPDFLPRTPAQYLGYVPGGRLFQPETISFGFQSRMKKQGYGFHSAMLTKIEH